MILILKTVNTNSQWDLLLHSAFSVIWICHISFIEFIFLFRQAHLDFTQSVLRPSFSSFAEVQIKPNTGQSTKPSSVRVCGPSTELLFQSDLTSISLGINVSKPVNPAMSRQKSNHITFKCAGPERWIFFLRMKTEKENQSDKRQMCQEMALVGLKDDTISIYCSVQRSLPLWAWLKMRTSRRGGGNQGC